MEKDRKKGQYNPFTGCFTQENFEEMCGSILNMMMTECAREFEKLPILENVEILRNILYSGVWVKYEMIHRKRTETGETKGK